MYLAYNDLNYSVRLYLSTVLGITEKNFQIEFKKTKINEERTIVRGMIGDSHKQVFYGWLSEEYYEKEEYGIYAYRLNRRISEIIIDKLKSPEIWGVELPDRECRKIAKELFKEGWINSNVASPLVKFLLQEFDLLDEFDKRIFKERKIKKF